MVWSNSERGAKGNEIVFFFFFFFFDILILQNKDSCSAAPGMCSAMAIQEMRR